MDAEGEYAYPGISFHLISPNVCSDGFKYHIYTYIHYLVIQIEVSFDGSTIFGAKVKNQLGRDSYLRIFTPPPTITAPPHFLQLLCWMLFVELDSHCPSPAACLGSEISNGRRACPKRTGLRLLRACLLKTSHLSGSTRMAALH